MVASEELLPQAVLRQIGDKLYEKRKVAALEVEQIVKRLAAAGDQNRIRLIIDKLIAEYAFSPQANHRKVRADRGPQGPSHPVKAEVFAFLVLSMPEALAMIKKMPKWSFACHAGCSLMLGSSDSRAWRA